MRRGEEAAGRISKDKDQTLIKNVFKKKCQGLETFTTFFEAIREYGEIRRSPISSGRRRGELAKDCSAGEGTCHQA